MKTCVLGLLLAAATMGRAEVRPGDPLDSVIRELGPPQGYIRAGDYTLLSYERGRVELRDDRVETADLVTEEEAVRLRAQRLAREEAQRQEADRQRAQRLIEGAETRDRKLADPLYVLSPPDDQVAFWQSFRVRYPETDVSLPYAEALSRLETQRKAEALESERRAQWVALENRVVAAEDRARRAEQRALRCVYAVPSWRASPRWEASPACGLPVKPCAWPRPAPVRSGLAVEVKWGSPCGSGLTFVSRR